MKMNSNKAKLSKAILASGLILALGCRNESNGDATKYTLSITKPTNGTLSSDAGGIDCGSKGNVCKAEFEKGAEVTLTAKADTDKGYILGAWQGACDKTGIEETCQLTMNANKSAGKAFLEKPILTIDPKPENGTLVSNPAGINCGSEGNDCEVEFDKVVEVTLTAKADTGYAPVAWQGDCDKMDADQPCTLSMDANKTAGRAFLVDTDGNGDPDITDPDDDGDGTDDTTDVDDDNDGLIEVHNLDMFDHIRHDLAGTSYKTSSSASDNRTGAPEAETDDCKTATVDGGKSLYLCGYELTEDLDFAEGASYAGSSVTAAWRPNDQADASGNAATSDSAVNAGFVGATDFAGLFEGNGYEISNLYSRHTARRRGNIGLFAKTTAAAAIRNLGVVDVHLYGNTNVDRVGGLVGENRGSILASYAKGGRLNGGAGADRIGGLVGENNNGSILASYATGDVNDNGIGSDLIGGLVGNNVGGSIIASYATGNVAGGTRVGGLVGENNNGSILASYATGNVNGENGNSIIGGLVGWNNNSIVACYATGTVNGNDRSNSVGGLVGFNVSLGGIGACYALGDVDGGDGTSNHVGTLAGQNAGSITHSYAFGTPTNVDTPGDAGTAHPGGLMGMGAAKANGLTDPAGVETTDADDMWDLATSNTKGAWDFGTSGQPPALKYADYDGAGDTYSCDMFPAKIPGTNDALTCGTSILPEQRP